MCPQLKLYIHDLVCKMGFRQVSKLPVAKLELPSATNGRVVDTINDSNNELFDADFDDLD